MGKLRREPDTPPRKLTSERCVGGTRPEQQPGRATPRPVLPARAGAFARRLPQHRCVAASGGMPTVTRNLVPTAQSRPEIASSAEAIRARTYLALIVMPVDAYLALIVMMDNDGTGDQSRSPCT